jgi:hypothetical protein
MLSFWFSVYMYMFKFSKCKRKEIGFGQDWTKIAPKEWLIFTWASKTNIGVAQQQQKKKAVQ